MIYGLLRNRKRGNDLGMDLVIIAGSYSTQSEPPPHGACYISVLVGSGISIRFWGTFFWLVRIGLQTDYRLAI
jgi:hypothetical protein